MRLTRREGEADGSARWTVAGVIPAIAVVLVAGFVLRLLLAFVVFPQSGLWSDIKLFADWSLTLADHGPQGFYTEVYWSDYTPGYLWVLWLYGVVMKVVADLTGGAAPQLIPIWLKVPAILGDLLVAWIFYRAIRRWHSERWGVIVAAVYLFVPVTWYDSALWGQVDTMGVLVGGLALIWLIDRKPELAAGAAIAAVLVKPQFGIFLPVVGLVLLRRHFRRPRRPDPTFLPAPGPGLLGELRGWWNRQDTGGPIRLVTSAIVAFVVLVVMTVPFDLESRAPEGWGSIPIIGDLRGLLALVQTTAGSYNYLTANAFNPWAMVGPTPLTQAIGSSYIWTYDSLDIFGMSAAFVGTALFVLVAAAVAVLLWRRQDRDAILIAAVTLAVAFFVLPTKVHERYLFAAVGIGVLLLPRSRAWWAWFAAAAGVLLVNMHAVLSLPFRGYGTEAMRDLPFADFTRTPLIVTLAALTCIPVLLWPMVEGFRLWREGPPPDEPEPAAAAPSEGVSYAEQPIAPSLPLRQRIDAVFDRWPRRLPGASTVASIVLVTVVSLIAALIAVRFSGLGGPWLWNFDLGPFMVPFAAMLHESVAGGHLPLWSDSVAMGMPIAAEGQMGALYPPNWLLFQLPPLTALDATRVLHLVLAGVGSGLITLRLSGSRLSMLLTSLIVVLGGGIAGKLEWHQMVVVYGWLPWMLLPLLWQRRTLTRWPIALAGAIWGVAALAGYPPMWTLMGIAGVVVIIVRLRSWKAIPALAAFGIIALGVGALQLVPTLMLVPLSDRAAGVGASALFEWSATPFDPLLLAFLNPFVSAGFPSQDIATTWYPAGSFWAILEGSAYVGLAAIALSMLGLTTRRGRPLLWLAVVFIAIPIIGIAQPAILASVPLINGLRHPIRVYTMLGPILGIAAGIGLARMGRLGRRRLALAAVVLLVGWYLASLVLVLVLPGVFDAIVGAFGAPGVDAASLRDVAREVLLQPLPVVVEVLLATMLLGMLWLQRSVVLRMAAVAIVAIPMAIWVPSINGSKPEASLRLSATPLGQALIAAQPRGLLALYEGPNLASTLPIAETDPSVHVFSPRFFTGLFLGATKGFMDELAATLPDTSLARAVGIDTILSYSAACPAGLEVGREPAAGAVICHIDGALSAPYWIPTEAVEVPGPALHGSAVDATADPAAAVTRAIPAVTNERTDHSGRYEVSAPADGFVFLDRSWFPRWSVSVDGVPTPSYRLWSGQLIPVTAGAHIIDETYVPFDVQVGAAISFGTLVLVGLAWAYDRRRVRRLALVRGDVPVRRPRPAQLGFGSWIRAVREALRPASSVASVTEEAVSLPAARPARRILRGHIGRRGLAVVLLFTLGMTGLRLFQLDRPLGWYFDEDLHGRTATEFLQDWRYGIPHDILEWTHPHLAKYLQAAGIEAIGGNEVSRRFDLGVDVVAVDVEPQGGNGSTTDPTPSRLIVASPDQLIVRELTGEELTLAFPIDGITHLAVQPDDRLLWAATSGGSLLRLELAQLDAGVAESDTPFVSNAGELEAPVDGLWALAGGRVAVLSEDTLYLWGPDGLIAETPAAGLTDVVPVGSAEAPRLALLLPDGVHLVNAADLAETTYLRLSRRPLGAALADGDDFRNRGRDLLPDPRLYVATRGGVASIGGMASDALFLESSITMPGEVRDVLWNSSSNMIHVLGEQDGKPTIYVIEPHGNAVYADAQLPADPVGWAMDIRTAVPQNDRQLAITVDAAGAVAEVGVGGNAFASRFPGAVLGGLAAGLLLMLLMLLVRSRAVAVIGGVLIAAETMLYAESRIATPDTMTICFVVASWTMLAWLFTRHDLVRRRLTWIVGFPMVGLLLGLAASTKWTGFYAFAGVLLFLLLINPRLRMVAVGAALVVSVGLSLLSLAGPTPNLQLVGVLAVSVALLVLWRRRWGSLPEGADAILPVRMLVYALVVIPIVGLAVYVVLFIPWAFLSLGDPQMISGWPAGHTGETFLQLQQRMFAFHDGLTQPHGAGTPWWSWPLMFKPLWAYLEGFRDGTGTILMPANPVVVWMSLPVVVWAIWRLLKGFSAPLLLLLAAFATQWLPWVRVERVAFFYHYATTVPFALALLALLLARIRTGVSPRGWVAVRAGAVAVLCYPTIAWLMTGPLCSTLNITPGAAICAGGWNEQIGLDILLGVLAFVVTIAAVGMGLARRWTGLDPRRPAERDRMLAEGFVGVVIVLGVALAAVAVGRAGILDGVVLTFSSTLMMAAVCAVIALPLIVLTAGARSSSRFVAGVLLAAVTLALLLWPVIAGSLVLPDALPYFAQSLLPTWETAFQFASGPGGILAGALIIGLPVLLVAGGAWWAIDRLDRRRAADDR